jgi:hypothetical protein
VDESRGQRHGRHDQHGRPVDQAAGQDGVVPAGDLRRRCAGIAATLQGRGAGQGGQVGGGLGSPVGEHDHHRADADRRDEHQQGD